MQETMEQADVHGHEYRKDVLFTLESLCERWGATEAQVLEVAADAVGIMACEYMLPGGSDVGAPGRFGLWDFGNVREAEALLPELSRGNVEGALDALRAAIAATDEKYPRVQQDWAGDWTFSLHEARWHCIAHHLTHRQKRPDA